MSETRARIVVISGPTASGKTDVALALARAQGGELVGADSVQVYRGFDVGSAKPTKEELGGIAHHLIDVVDPDEAIDAARYAELADAAIADVAARGKLPIVVGGTGLWLRALLRGLVVLPPPDPAIRGALEEEVRTLGAPALHARLAAIDPKASAAIHPNDALRIVRALEVHAQTGEPIGELRARHALGAPRYDALVVLLDRPRPEMDARMVARTEAMLARGLVDEVRGLITRWGRGVRGLDSVGYAEVRAYLEGTLPERELAPAITRATRVYARRQRTWWGHDETATRLTDASRFGEVPALVERWREQAP
ncbi:MAG: tRNA (adenosine(37)-N6)-dimethylallyltransferase MiaA [Sandaracinus sp.]